MSNAASQTKPLSSFASFEPSEIFTNASTYPDFFNTHLVDPLRVIKVFKDDPNGLERIFYYQYLRLCTEEDTYPDIRIENMRIILTSPEFSFTFPADSLNFPYTDAQFKRLGLQFLDLLKESPKKLNELLKKYPIIDLVFTYVMRSLLILNMQAEECEQFVDKEQLLGVLGRIFDVEFENMAKCTKFVQSDVFVYEESAFQMYMVYLRNEKQVKENQKPVVKELEVPMMRKNSSKKERNEMYKSNTSNQNYDFVDYTGLQNSKMTTNAALFMSQNLSLLKPFNKIQNELQTKFQQSPSKNQKYSQINIISATIKQQHSVAHNNEIMMQVDVATNGNSLKVQANNLDIDRTQQRKPSCDVENELSGFESDEDEPKFVAVFPTATTIDSSHHFQATNRTSGTSIEEKLQNVQLDGQKELLTASQKEFSFKNESSRLPVQPISQKQPLTHQTPLPKQYDSYKISPFRQLQRHQIQYTVKRSIPTLKETYNSYNIPIYPHHSNYTSNIPVLRLNVTKQFTNSMILKEMPELYRDGILRARERARAFRKTMLQILS